MKFYRFLQLFIACNISLTAIAQYSVFGSASQISTDQQCFQLTPNNNFAMGAVWSDTPLDLSQSFEIVSDVSFGCNEGQNGADGIAFVLQNQGPIEPTGIGGKLGYEGISPSLAVQFDTYQDNPIDFPEINDPPDPNPFNLQPYAHVGLMKNGNISHSIPGDINLDDLGTMPFTPFFIDVSDCNSFSNHQLTISWDVTTTTFKVEYCYFDLVSGSPQGPYTVVDKVIDISAEIFSGQTSINWGFTASTGGETNTQEVCIRYFDQKPMLLDTTICINENLILDYSTLSNFSFEWSDEFGTAISNLPILNVSPTSSTTYNLELTNNCSGKIFNESFDVTVLAPVLTEDISQHIDIECFGESSGQLSLNFINGVGAINYSLDLGPEQNNPTFSNLTASNYLVTATDGNGCSDNLNIVITQESELVLLVDNIVGVVCNTTSSGSIEVTPSGGVGSYDLSWIDENGVNYTDEDLFNLIDGDYFYTLSDGNNCEINSLVTVNQLNGIDIIDNAINQVDCFEEFTGSIDVIAFGGLFPYDYNWQGPNGFAENNSLINNLEAGTYELTVTDDENCYKEFTYDIQQGDEVVLISNSIDASCFNVADGTIDLTHLGGTGTTSPFLLNAASNIISTTSSTSFLLPGNYTAFAEDNLNCQSDIINIVIGSPSNTQIIASIDDAACFEENQGSIDVNISGGTPPYSNFSWTGPNTYTSSQQNISQLYEGNYILSLSDFNNCLYTQSFSIDQPQKIDILTDNIGFVKCSGTNTGSISISTTGGTLPISNFSWTGPNGFTSNSMNIIDLFQGDYEVITLDANGCSQRNTFTVYEPDSILQFTTTTTNSCIIEDIGTAELSIIGGVPPYNTIWLGANPLALPSGLNTVVVSDAADCIVTQEFVVDSFPQPSALFEIDTLIKANVTYLIDNYSNGAQEYFWEFENIGSSDAINPYLTYQDEGEYLIKLTARNQFGCSDTISKITKVSNGISIFLANAFTPNNDILNDTFKASVIKYDSFKMDIYSRNGQLIFTSNDPNIGWDGTYKNEAAQLGVYIVKVTAYDLFGKVYIQNQKLTLLK
jgi:large repetitive protein